MPKQTEMRTPPMASSLLKCAAPLDNMTFCDQLSAMAVEDIDFMDVDEMKDLASVLRYQKDELERRLDQALQKGRSQPQIRLEFDIPASLQQKSIFLQSPLSVQRFSP
jgi:hypothetical protein